MRKFCLAVSLSLALPCWSFAAGTVLVPGCGAPPPPPAKTDCYSEFQVDATSAKNKTTVECTDGDPTCDADGACDKTCTFNVKVCAKQSDSSLSRCTSPDVTSFPRNTGGLNLPATPVSTATCGDNTQVVVALKRNGAKPGTKVLKLKALTGGRPPADADVLKLICKPRLGSCPTQPTRCGDGLLTNDEICDGSATPTGCGTGATCTGDCSACVGPCTGVSKLKVTVQTGSSTCTFGSASSPFSGEVQDSGGTKIADLGTGCLYIGQKGDSTPAGSIPDGNDTIFKALCSNDDLSQISLLGDAANDLKDCTLGAGPGKICLNGDPGTGGGACTVKADCHPGSADVGDVCIPKPNCYFGPPLPIPNPATPGLSTCVLNVIASDGSGTANATTGASSVTLPLSSLVYITGNVTAPCAQCVSGHCVGGRNNGGTCTAVGTKLTSLDCLPGGADTYVGALPVSLSDVSTSSTTRNADSDGKFCTDVFGSDPGTGTPVGGVKQEGAFGSAGANVRKIITTGSLASGGLSTSTQKDAVVSASFCIPASGNTLIDGAAGIAGPGAVTLPVKTILLP